MPQPMVIASCAGAVVDDHAHQCMVLVANTSLSDQRVVREFDTIIALRGRPLTALSDNGTEFTSMAILLWSQRQQTLLEGL